MLVALAAHASPTLHAADGDILVDAIDVVGLRTQDPGRVRSLLLVRPNRSYPLSGLQRRTSDDVRTLESMGPFTAVRAEFVNSATATRVVYFVSELPYVSQVLIQGVGLNQEDSLAKVLTTKRGGYLNPLHLESDRLAVLGKLRDDGWKNAVVTPRVLDAGPFKEVHFEVALNDPVKVGRTVLLNLPSGVRPWMFEPTLFNQFDRPWQPDLLDFDRRAVLAVLAKQGYLEATLRSCTVEWNDLVLPFDERGLSGLRFVPDGVRNDRAVVVYDLVPGPRYTLGSVTFVGTTLATQDELRAAFTTKNLWGDQVPVAEGTPLIDAVIRAAAERSKRVIANRGYARCSMAVNILPRPGTTIADVTITLNPGKVYNVGRVDVDGNARTRDAVLRRALTFGPGDLWSEDNADESERQLRRISLFEKERQRLRLERTFPDERPGEVDVTASVYERESGSFSFQIGYSQIGGVFGQVTYHESNFDLLGFLGDGWRSFRGAGHSLETSINISQTGNAFTLSHSNPNLLDGPFTTQVVGQRSQSSARDWDETRTSGSTTLGRNFLNNDLALSLGYRYTDLTVRSIRDEASNDVQPLHAYQNTIIFSQSYDRLDNRRQPTAGWAVNAREEITGVPLQASSDFFDYALSGRGYLPLARNEDLGTTLVRIAARWRQLVPVSGDELPFYERVVDGGPSPRHRGFSPNRLGPQSINAKGLRSYDGGDRNLLVTSEFVTPISGGDEGLRGLAFLDVGNVWGRGESAGIDDLRTAFGVGIRMPSSIPVALDFAWLVAPRNDESVFQFHFGIEMIRF